MKYEIRIMPTTTGNPPGRVAEVEIHFTADSGSFTGLKLAGFAIWERRHDSRYQVTFPARQYAVNGERRSFALLRPSDPPNNGTGQERMKEDILDAWTEYQRSGQDGPYTVKRTDDAERHRYIAGTSPARA